MSGNVVMISRKLHAVGGVGADRRGPCYCRTARIITHVTGPKFSQCSIARCSEIVVDVLTLAVKSQASNRRYNKSVGLYGHTTFLKS